MDRAHSSIVVIEPRGAAADNGPKTIWNRRELILMLAMRSIRTRFRDTTLGILWAFGQPLIYFIVLNAFFGLIARFDTGEIPYPLHLMTGLIAFQLFTKSISEGTGSIVGNGAILSKIYIPLVVFPSASIISSLIDFVFPASLMILFLVYYQVPPTLNMVYLPVALLMLLTLCVAAQIAMSVLVARFKDVRHTVPIITQLLFFGSPIFYPLTLIPEAYRVIYGLLNPMVGAIELWRWALLGMTTAPDWAVIQASAITTSLMLVVSFVLFRWLAPTIQRYL